MKKYIFIFILCISMLLVFGFTFSASAATTDEFYNESSEETIEYILDNIDIPVEDLEPEVMGIYFTGSIKGQKDTALLYLIWVSEYMARKSNTILQLTESGKVYNLYSTKSDMENFQSNWMSTISKSYPSENICVNVTSVGGYINGRQFGINMDSKVFSFENIKYGYEGTNQPLGQIQNNLKFDLGGVPKLGSKPVLMLKTHAYEIVRDIQVMSVYEPLQQLGYHHYVYLNFNVKVDSIYRLDVSYNLGSDSSGFLGIFRPKDSRQITKSLSMSRRSGGIFNLYEIKSFEVGEFSSTNDASKKYKFKILLNHEEDNWDIFKGSEYIEGDYQYVTDFKIFRINYIADSESYSVNVKMDAVDGVSLKFYDKDVILDNDSLAYKVRDTWDDLLEDIKTSFNNFKNNFDQYKTAFIIIGCCLGGIVLMIPLLKFIFYMKSLLGNKGKDQTG